MTWCIEGLARGPQGQAIEITWGGLPETIEIGSEMTRLCGKIYETFPQFFGCDPTHVEVHKRKEDDDADPGEAATAV